MLLPPKPDPNEQPRLPQSADRLERKLENAVVPLATLLPQCPDTRDRSAPKYLMWEQQLAEDIGRRGILNPIHVLRTPLGLRVLAGETRRRAGLLAGVADACVTVHDYPMTEGEAALQQLLDDEMRQPLTDTERMEKYVSLVDLNGWSTQQLAQQVGRSQSYVWKLMSVFETYPEDLRAKIGKGADKVPVTGAVAIARLESVEMIREVMEISLTRRLKRDAIIDLVNQRLNKKPPGPKPLKIKCGTVLVTITGNVVEALKNFITKANTALTKLERDKLPPEFLGGLMN